MRKDTRKPYRIIGVYDSETTNVHNASNVYAFPILHQLGITSAKIEDITNENVESCVQVELYRHALDLYARLNELVSITESYIPVICCHNLAFDMYGLSPWLSSHNVRVLAKSARKPITFTILDDNDNPRLVLWDTLVFSGQSLEKMGNDCGYSKAVGSWNYDLIRTPETPLTENELTYARKDVYTLFAWLSWWLHMNPDIAPEKLGLNVVTKTGVVRERRTLRFDSIKGIKRKENVGRYWHYTNNEQAPKSDDELFTMQAATRGGFTFCAAKSASCVYDLANTGKSILGFDATSQHLAQMVSHRVPVDFHEITPELLDLCFDIVRNTTLDKVLYRWSSPFPVAFNACFEFTNLRPKKDSLFEKMGIYPLAAARYKTLEQLEHSGIYNDDNGDDNEHAKNRAAYGYMDNGENIKTAFGKIMSADKVQLYITELTAFEICQCYEFDSVSAVHGYYTGRFVRPTDMSVISVMQFYGAKNAFKVARETYYERGTIDNAEELEAYGISKHVIDNMIAGTLSDSDVESVYFYQKSNVNSLFGIECSNEYRRDTFIGDGGIEYTGGFGICNAPKNHKAWYQYGQRIVGWSRIAQICVMELIEPYVEQIINGDTDSLKVLATVDNLGYIEKALSEYAKAIDKAKNDNCKRVFESYPELYNSLENIGHYVLEFSTDRFCASWNKAYCLHDIDKRDGKRHFKFTLAGIPTSKRENDNECFIGLDGYADRLYALGMTFEDICNLFLGYNVTFANDLIRLNGRAFPQWNTFTYVNVTDYLSNECKVMEPASLALYPISKTVNDTHVTENRVNRRYAIQNNPSVNFDPIIVYGGGVTRMDELI